MRKILRLAAKSVAGLLLLVIVLAVGLRLAAHFRETEEAAALAPANGQFIDSTFGKLHVSFWGDPGGQPVIMTHGMAAWGGLWRETAEALAGKGYRVIALDQAPFGFSDNENSDYSRSSEALRLVEVLDGLKIDKALLVGHSYGGGVALEAALRFPGRFRGMVLVCPVTGLFGRGDGAPSVSAALPLPLRSQFMREMLVSATASNPLLTRFLLGRFAYLKQNIRDDHIEVLKRPLMRIGTTTSTALWLKQFIEGDPQALSMDRKAVAQYSVPAELVWGDMDTVTPIEQGDDLAGLMQVSHFTRLAGVGHMPQIEDPARFNEALAAALGRLSVSPFASWEVRPVASAF